MKARRPRSVEQRITRAERREPTEVAVGGEQLVNPVADADRPGGPTAGESLQARTGAAVPWRIPAMWVDEDVRVDADQPPDQPPRPP